MSVRKVNDLQFTADDFGQCFHTASSEPFFYEESYYHHKDQCSSTVDVPALFKKQVHKIRCDSCVPESDRKHMIAHLENQIGDMDSCHCMKHTTPIVIDEKGRCKISEEIGERNVKSNRPSKWKCTTHCKLPTTEQRQHIMDLKALFKEQVRKLCRELNHVDSGCNNNHYSCTLTSHELAGHPSTCITSGCDSKLRILRTASPHYPMLRRFLNHLYEAIRYHKLIDSIDSALSS